MFENKDFSTISDYSKRREIRKDLTLYLKQKGFNILRLYVDTQKTVIYIISTGAVRNVFEFKGYEYYQICGEKQYFRCIYEQLIKELTKKEISYNKSRNTLLQFINKNKNLKKINSNRSRNYILYRNELMDVVYDLREETLVFDSRIPFSNIEHDTNRKYAEKICLDFLLDFENSKDKFIKLLKNPYRKEYKGQYKKYIKIIKGESKSYDEDDILVMLSILGRLSQEKRMGPIGVQVAKKLDPKQVIEHVETKKYLLLTLFTIKEYTNLYLADEEQMKHIGNLDFEGKLSNKKLLKAPIPLLDYKNREEINLAKSFDLDINVKDPNEDIVPSIPQSISIAKPKKDNAIYQPNYIESFFKKLISVFEKQGEVPIIIDNFKDIEEELLSYSRRYKGNRNPDFITLGKMKGIFSYYDFNVVLDKIKNDVFVFYEPRTYYKILAEHIIELSNINQQKQEIYKLLSIFENHIIKEISYFISYKKDNVLKDYNDDEITIVSDMHFNNLKDINKGNFSKNFNIIAGDFYNNIYHRSGMPITESLDIKGIGVIGNHDVNWVNSISDIEREVNTNYKKSLENLNKAFPNIKILNNEVYYKNNVAFVGLTIVTDDNLTNRQTVERTFFANSFLGKMFKKEDYLKTARSLLDSIDKNTPIVLITHSPFKEYAVCKNKEIGIYSKNLFKDYPNLKLYVHGHGHSSQNSKVIDDVLCVTNPIINNIYNESNYSINWHDIYK